MTKFEGNTAHFSDGSTREIDAVILCTGYQHHFPFMEDALRLRTGNRLWPPGLYKGVVWLDNTKLFYLGMQDQYYTFSMFDAQAWYVRDVILGRIALPPREEMEKDMAEWQAREEALEDPIQDIDYQTDYCKDLSAPTDYEMDWDIQSDNFKALGAPQGRGHHELPRPLASVAGDRGAGPGAPHGLVGGHGRHAGDVHEHRVAPPRHRAGPGIAPGPASFTSHRGRPLPHRTRSGAPPPAACASRPKPCGRSARQRSSRSASSGRPARLAARTSRPCAASVRQRSRGSRS